MSIIRIPRTEYEKYIIPARTNQSNQVYLLSIAEGKQSVDIFVDAADSANTVLFWHYCGFAYLSGTGRTSFLDEVYEEFFLKEQKRRIIPSFSWESEERFLDKGFGYIALEGDAIAAVAFSAAVSFAEVDIGVETMELFRNKGYAKILSRCMCREILRQGKQPVWAHVQQNIGSERTALSCGFLEYKRNTVIRKV